MFVCPAFVTKLSVNKAYQSDNFVDISSIL